MFMRILLAGSAAAMILVQPAAAQEMDCDAMFSQAERMLAENTEADVDEKVEVYRIALEAYEACEAGESEEERAERLFREVFDTAGGM